MKSDDSEMDGRFVTTNWYVLFKDVLSAESVPSSITLKYNVVFASDSKSEEGSPENVLELESNESQLGKSKQLYVI